MPEFVCPHCHHVYKEKKGNCPTDGSILIEVPVMNDLSGEVFKKKYKLEEALGHGGFGSVYKGTHLVLGRPVAIKVLRSEFRSDSTMVTRFFNEARVVTKLTNPHTINTFDLDQTEEGLLFMVMDFVEGETLRKLARSEGDPPGRLAWQRAVRLLLQVCDSLSEAHEAGVVHRDLKPDNIMISNRGGEADFATVLDFGIAKVIEGTDMANLTGTGMILGSPAYMSPEQIVGAELDARSDLYSLGAVAYHVLSGALPCTAKQTAAILQEKVQAPPPRPTKRVPDINLPVELEDLVMRLLALNRDDRPATAGEVKIEFKRVLDLYRDVEDSPDAYQAAFKAHAGVPQEDGGTRGYSARDTGAQSGLPATSTLSPDIMSDGSGPATRQVPTAQQHQMPQDMPTSAGQQSQTPPPMQTGQQPMQTGQQPMQQGYGPGMGQPMQTGYGQQMGQPMQTGYGQQMGQPMQTGYGPQMGQPMQTGYGPQMGYPGQTGMGQMPQPYVPPGSTVGQQPAKSKAPLIIGVVLLVFAAAAFGLGYKYLGIGSDADKEETQASADKEAPAKADQEKADEDKAEPAAVPATDVQPEKPASAPDVQPEPVAAAPDVQPEPAVASAPEVRVQTEEIKVEPVAAAPEVDVKAEEPIGAKMEAVEEKAGGVAAVPEEKVEPVERKAAPVKAAGRKVPDKAKKSGGSAAAAPVKDKKKPEEKKEADTAAQPQKIIIIQREAAPADSKGRSAEEDLRAAETKRRTAEELRRAAEEMRRAEEEKHRAQEEKRGAQEEKRRAQEEKRGAEEEKRKAEEEKRKAEEEKHKAEEERRKAEEERRKAEEERRKAEEERRKGRDERSAARGDGKDESKTDEANRKLEEERRKAEEARRKAEEERRKAEEEKRKAEEAKRKAEEEKRKAEEEKRKAAEEKKKAAEEKKKAAEEKARKQREKDRKAEEIDDYQINDDAPPESKKTFDELDDGW